MLYDPPWRARGGEEEEEKVKEEEEDQNEEEEESDGRGEGKSLWRESRGLSRRMRRMITS